MTFLSRWFGWRAPETISDSLARIEQGQAQIMANLDDLKAGQAKERALIEKLLGLLKAVPAGTFTPDQQAEIDGIFADQAATLAEDTTTPSA